MDYVSPLADLMRGLKITPRPLPGRRKRRTLVDDLVDIGGAGLHYLLCEYVEQARRRQLAICRGPAYSGKSS